MVSVIAAVRDLGRLREISSVLVRHGFGEIVSRAGLGRAKRPRPVGAPPGASEPPPGDAPEIASEEVERGEDEKKNISIHERLRLVLQDLGPSFIKLGQIASTRPDILPPELIRELKKLQDDVPPVAFDDIRQVLEASLGASIAEIYETFDEKPLATASIGQVHRAVLATPEGHEPVVVKVQRPNVGITVARDLELLHILAATIERAIPETKIYSPVALVQQFDRSIMAELNFLIEADNAERFAKNFDGKSYIRFPKVYRQATSKHVLTLEFFNGKKIDRAIAGGASGSAIAKNSVGLIIKMIFEDGFFHADPHPGNVIILGTNEEPVVGLIDLGMVGRLSPEMRDRTIDLMLAAVRKDSYGVADALYAIGRPTKKVDMREYRAEVALLAEKYIGKPMKELEISAMIRDLIGGATKYSIEMPPDFMMVGKSLMTIEGIGKEIDPELDVLGEATPYFLELMKARYSPQRIGNELLRGVEQLSRAGYDMPLQVREVLEDLRLGRLTVRAVDPSMALAVDRLGRRLFSSLVVASLVGSGSYLAGTAEHSVFGSTMLVLAAVIWLLHAVADTRRTAKQRKRPAA
jgi:ubiquinone biosynthesis protein